MKKIGTRNFRGHYVRDNPLAIAPDQTPDCGNVRVDNPIGCLNNLIGIQKYSNAGAGAPVVAIHQIDSRLFVVGDSGGGTLPGRVWKCLNPFFLAFPFYGEVPLTVQFVDLTIDLGSDITAWAWDFGDGETSTDQHPMHEYTDSGIYTVTLVVSAGDLDFSITYEEYILVYDSEGEVEDEPIDDYLEDEYPYADEYVEGESTREYYDDELDKWIQTEATGAHWAYNEASSEWEYVASGNIAQDEIPDSIMPDGLKKKYYITHDAEIKRQVDTEGYVTLTDTNYGTRAGAIYGSINTPTWYRHHRAFFKYDGGIGNAVFRFFNFAWSKQDTSYTCKVYEVTEDWDESTITWNNQPSLGSELDSFDMAINGWREINIGTATSWCFKLTEPIDFDYGISWASTVNSSEAPSNLPYCYRK